MLLVRVRMGMMSNFGVKYGGAHKYTLFVVKGSDSKLRYKLAVGYKLWYLCVVYAIVTAGNHFRSLPVSA
jgi:hypothetical protein